MTLFGIIRFCAWDHRCWLFIHFIFSIAFRQFLFTIRQYLMTTSHCKRTHIFVLINFKLWNLCTVKILSFDTHTHIAQCFDRNLNDNIHLWANERTLADRSKKMRWKSYAYIQSADKYSRWCVLYACEHPERYDSNVMVVVFVLDFIGLRSNHFFGILTHFTMQYKETADSQRIQ